MSSLQHHKQAAVDAGGPRTSTIKIQQLQALMHSGRFWANKVCLMIQASTGSSMSSSPERARPSARARSGELATAAQQYCSSIELGRLQVARVGMYFRWRASCMSAARRSRHRSRMSAVLMTSAQVPKVACGSYFHWHLAAPVKGPRVL